VSDETKKAMWAVFCLWSVAEAPVGAIDTAGGKFSWSVWSAIGPTDLSEDMAQLLLQRSKVVPGSKVHRQKFGLDSSSDAVSNIPFDKSKMRLAFQLFHRHAVYATRTEELANVALDKVRGRYYTCLNSPSRTLYFVSALYCMGRIGTCKG
jgi:hypothetical protein